MMAGSNTSYSPEQNLRTIIYSNHHTRDLVQHTVTDFLNLREELLTKSGIQDLLAFKDVLSPLIEGSRIEQLNARITSDKVHLAFSGENSSGKTAFLHTFLGIGKILPSGDGPVTARITKLTYASGEQACIRIRKTLRDPTLIKDEMNLSEFFAAEKPNWAGVGRALAEHVKRPENIVEKSPEFAEWAQCFVEIHIPSPTLALGIDVYDTPGFLLDDAPVLKEILHDLVELIHPTLVFMYANPSTDDATRSCFLAMKTALHDLDSTSIFFLNSKADINRMPKLKQGMSGGEFLTILADERAQRYNLLIRAPLLSNDRLEGLPASVLDCHCFDLCSVNSQLMKPYGPMMNEITIRRIIQFVANNDLAVATRICKLTLPIIDAFFDLISLTSHRTTSQLLQLHFDAMNWEKSYFQEYAMYTQECLKDLFANIFQQFNIEEESIVQILLNTCRSIDHIEPAVQAAVRLQIIVPAVRDTLRKFMGKVLEHIASNSDLMRSVVSNEILNSALGRQELSDFAALLLDGYTIKEYINISIVYMVNTISTPIVECSRKLKNLDLCNGISNVGFLAKTQELSKEQNQSLQPQVDKIVRGHLLSMQKLLAKQQDTMCEAVTLWGDQQKAVLRSLIDVHYDAKSPLVDSHQQTLTVLEQYISRFIVIECKLRAAKDMAKFSGKIPEIRTGDTKSTMFSIFTADWGDKKNLIVKKLSQSLPDQPNAAYYEAHYHRKVANLYHPNIVSICYLYEHHQDSELWMIFPPIIYNLEQFLQQHSTLLPIAKVIRWMNNIADALVALHENELVHRNVILSNIVFAEDEHTLLIDLGNWYRGCNLSVRHDPSSTLDGTNDDVKGFGEIGLILSACIEQDEKVLAIIDEFNELMFKCSQANHAKPVTAEFARQRLKFMLDMF